MRPYPIFCPSCDALILDAPVCPECDWARPGDSAEVGQITGTLALPARPVAGSQPVVVRNRLWIPAECDGAGALIAAQVSEPAPGLYPLPEHYLARDLCAAADVLFVGPADAATLSARGKALLAIDGQTGETRWRHPVPDAHELSPAALAGDVVCFAGSHGRVYGLHLDGKLKWSLPLAGADTRYAPAVLPVLVVVSTGSGVTAIQSNAGQVAWTSNLGSTVTAPVAASDRAVCVALIENLMCLDPRTGKSAWRNPYKPPRITARKGALTSPPAMTESLVIFGCGDWQAGQAGYAVHAVRLDNGKLEWSFRLGHRLQMRPALAGSLVLCADDSGTLSALDVASGRLVWAAQGIGKPACCPVTLDDYVVVANQTSQLHIVRLKPATSLPPHPAATHAERGEWSQAAVAFALAGELSTAGECLLKTGDARHALKLFEHAELLDGVVHALAMLGRFADAAAQLANDRQYAEAGEYYQRAAQQHQQAAPGQKDAIADLWRKAAENYALEGRKAVAQQCQREAARILAEPILELAEVKLDSALMVGSQSRLEVVVRNDGFGPARRLRVKAVGKGFGYEAETPVGNAVDILAKGEAATALVGLTPEQPGPGVELKLMLYYEWSGGKTALGPFQSFLHVLRLDDTKPSAIHIANFEYIGPGGIHAQDVVAVRPNYGAGMAAGANTDAAFTVSQVIDHGMQRLLKD